VDVTITADPSGLFAPTNFDAVYINDHKVTITWVTNPLAVTTHIRGKTGSYPTGIADGYQVYNGAGVTVDDETVSLDETATNVYYRAWSVGGGGAPSPDYAEDNLGGVGMTLIAFFGFALIMTWIYLRNRAYWIMSLFTSAAWFFELAYWTTGGGRPTTITAGTPADQIIVYMMLGLGMLFIALPLFVENDGTLGFGRFRVPAFIRGEEEEPRYQSRPTSRRDRIEAYRARANNAMNGRR
jgi:hypothetical protein